MALSELLAVVPPPTTPTAPVDPARWAQAEAEMGLRFPDDYKEFIDHFGTSKLPNEVDVYSPFGEAEHNNLLRHNNNYLPFFEQELDAGGGYLHEFYPSTPGLLLVGWSRYMDWGIFWIASRDHSEWPIFLTGHSMEWQYRQHNCSLTSFLAKHYRGEIGEHDWEVQSQSQWVPLLLAGPQDWQACPNPGRLRQTFLAHNQSLSARRRRLLRCHICRQLYADIKADMLWETLALASDFADGRLTEEARQAAEDRLHTFMGQTLSVDYDPGAHRWKALLSCIAVEDEDTPWPGEFPFGSFERTRADRIIAAACHRELLENPFHPVALAQRWLTADTLGLARSMYESNDFRAMPMLADALMDAGCDDEHILAHCTSDDPHGRGCWVVDRLLGLE